VSTPGSEAYNALLDLSEKTEFEHIQQRLKLWANNRAAADTEEKAFTLQDVRASFTEKAFVPYDRDSLFDVVLSKLDEVEHYLKNDDYSNIANWIAAEEEKDIQKLLADRLNERRNQLFSIERETEVFNKKEPDIRVTAPNTNVKA
ncbi:hypothetical protein ACTVFP_23235, partial [Escherichia coli]|uniref:hypothetical protein n=1 Tax=Escherichia coli TaxID=562 RepID=UPI003FA5DE69